MKDEPEIIIFILYSHLYSFLNYLTSNSLSVHSVITTYGRFHAPTYID